MRLLALAAPLVWAAAPLWAAPHDYYQAKSPDLFDALTGYRIASHRGPTPDTIPPPAILISPEEARDLLQQGALPVDVFGAAQSRFDDLDGTWLVSKERLSLPGAIWLPEVGRGRLEPLMARYLTERLEQATGGDRDVPLVIFCVADCWMSWNAAQRVAAMGYSRVYWYRFGTDGWLDIGEPLVPVDPLPVNTD